MLITFGLLKVHNIIDLKFCIPLIQVLLKGANGDELKKVKHVMQYGVFAAYHLALETSFLADEGASLPEFPLKSPVKVALPDKPSGIDRSISTIREFTVAHDNFDSKQPYQSSCNIFSHNTSSNGCLLPEEKSSLSEGSNSIRSAQNHVNSLSSSHCLRDTVSDCHREEFCGYPASNEREKVQLSLEASSVCKPSEICTRKVQEDSLNSSCSCNSEAVGKGHCYLHSVEHCLPSNSSIFDHLNEVAFLKGEFSSSASDNQSILVSLMTRCVWKRSVCERAHLFRIKYYGTFDKPLGRFLRDNLFDQVCFHLSYCIYMLVIYSTIGNYNSSCFLLRTIDVTHVKCHLKRICIAIAISKAVLQFP